eukprot:9368021-Alexandrium_andersonii.AAC.1
MVGAAGGHGPALPGTSRALDVSVPGQSGWAGDVVSPKVEGGGQALAGPAWGWVDRAGLERACGHLRRIARLRQ